MVVACQRNSEIPLRGPILTTAKTSLHELNQLNQTAAA